MPKKLNSENSTSVNSTSVISTPISIPATKITTNHTDTTCPLDIINTTDSIDSTQDEKKYVINVVGGGFITINTTHLKNSETLSILIEQASIDDEIALLKLPKTIIDTKISNIKDIIFHVFDMLLTNDTQNDMNNIITQSFVIQYIAQYDVFLNILKILKCKGIIKSFCNTFDKVVEDVINKDTAHRIKLLKIFCETQDLLDKIIFKITHKTMEVLLAMIADGLNCYAHTFYKILNRVYENNTNDWIEIKLNGPMMMQQIDLPTIDMPTLLKRFNSFSYDLFNTSLIKHISESNNIYIAGGFLIGCIKNNIKQWSDIDLWVHGSTHDEIIKHTTELVEKIKIVFKEKGIDKILWSTKNNVVTMYCPSYDRNIQIMMTDKPPQQYVAEFDIDALCAFTNFKSLYCTVECLHCVEKNEIRYIHTAVSPYRLVKMFLKGFHLSSDHLLNCYKYKNDSEYRDNIKKIINIALIMESKYHIKIFKSYGYIDRDDIEEKDESKKRKIISEIDDMITNVTNKYYYPTMYEVDSFINCKTFLERKQTRAAYLIKQICGHTIIEHDVSELLKNIESTVTEYYI